MADVENNNKTTGGCTGSGFQPGQSGNPGGRPKLPEEIKEIKKAVGARAIQLLWDTIQDEEYVKKLKPNEKLALIEAACDRGGFPRSTKLEGDAENPLIPRSVEDVEARINELIAKRSTGT